MRIGGPEEGNRESHHGLCGLGRDLMRGPAVLRGAVFRQWSGNGFQVGREQVVETDCVIGKPIGGEESLVDDQLEQRRQQMRISAGSGPEARATTSATG